MATIDSTPKQDGFHMPGEFEPHAGCWMLWPERPDNWRMSAKPAQAAFSEVAEAIARFEPVTMGVSKAQYVEARQNLSAAIRVVEIPYDDSWIRDTGPTFVVSGEGLVRGVDWEFKAWSGPEPPHYASWDRDALLARKVLDLERADRYKSDLVLEGGSIHADGEGTLLTTEECLLNRNPDLGREGVEEKLIQYLGAEQVLWLGEGVHGVVEVEGTKRRQAGERLPASYINFYIPNGGIVAPSFGDPHDEPALAKLRELFPDRKVVTVPAREILLGGGCIHCIVQQRPRG